MGLYSVVCFAIRFSPMEVAPLEQITKIKQEILTHKEASDSRSIRHRKVLVDLVKEGGWIDERQFGLQVVGNYFKDLRGLLSLAPLGLRMLLRGKFPLSFEPSEGDRNKCDRSLNLCNKLKGIGNRE